MGPRLMTDNGFNSLDGMSFAPDGTLYIAKGGYYMGVKPGEVIEKRTALPKVLFENGFVPVEAISFSPHDGAVYAAKNGHYMGVKNDTVFSTKKPFPAEA